MENSSLEQKFAALEAMFRDQQTELAALREALACKNANPLAPALSPLLDRSNKAPDTTRRRMLKKMGLAVLAGGAALGITAVTYSPVEARIIVNSPSNVGAIITRNGATISHLPIPNYYGLIVTADDSLDASVSGVLPTGYVGISGLSASIGVYGYSQEGIGVVATSQNGIGLYGTSSTLYGVQGVSRDYVGVYGSSQNGTGIFGEAISATQAAIVAYNNSSASESGIALKILRGGLTVTNAGVSSHTAAFIHQATDGNSSGHITTIDNPFCNGLANALLLVTHNYNPPNGSISYNNHPIGVYYLASHWTIYNEDITSISGSCFNVLIINA